MDLDRISPRLIGRKIILGPTREDLNDTYRRWLHDPENCHFLIASRLITHEGENEWFALNRREGNVHFTVYDKETGTPIGTTGFMHLDMIARTAEFGIMIGEKDYQNHGYGTEGTALTVDYGFNVLNFASIFLRVHAFNERAIRVYEKVGFKKIGLRRRAYFFGGEYHDDVFMDILPGEFEGGVIKDSIRRVEDGR